MRCRTSALFVVAAVLGGSAYLFTKLAVAHLGSPAVVWLRCVIAAAILVPSAWRQKAFQNLHGRWKLAAALALLQIAAPFLLIALGIRYITSSLTGTLIAAEPLFVAALAMRFDYSERPTTTRWAGLVTGMTGVIILLGLDVHGNRLSLLGALLVLLATFAYAIAALIIKRHFLDVSPLGISAVTLGISAAVLTPLGVASLPGRLPGLAALGAVAVLGVACTAGAFVSSNALICDMGASRAVVVAYVSPAVSVALGVLFLGEPATGMIIPGFLLVLVGSWLSTGGGLPPGVARALSRACRLPRALNGRMPGDPAIPVDCA